VKTVDAPAERRRGLTAAVERVRRLIRLRRAAPVEEPIAETAASVAIIMDGNGRWARQRSLPLLAGHRAGTKALRRTVEAAPDLGVRSLAVYAFSTENWGRPEQEVADLMALFEETIRDEFPDLHRQGVRVRFVGRRDRCPQSLLELMDDMERRTAENQRLDLWVAFDYGGRDELVQAARELVRSGVDAEQIDEQAIRAHLYAPRMPDPDLVIRTSGELRVSNFLLWQSAYAEYHFTQTLWPDFGGDELREAITAYAQRRRRYGRR
jgi:undecaprenyl diphosphate synthase